MDLIGEKGSSRVRQAGDNCLSKIILGIHSSEI